MARRRSDINLNEVRKRYLDALLAGDVDAASAAVAETLSGKVAISQIYIEVLAPAMVIIGELWCEARINVAQEHLATQITIGQLEKLKLLQTVPRPARYRVVISCVEGEFHFLGARMAADLFQSEGWSVDFLGPDVPTRALIDIVNARRPDLLGLSVALDSNLKTLAVLLRGLMTIPERPRLLVGGQIAGVADSWKNEFQEVEFATNVAEGMKLARRILKPRRSLVLLNEYLKELGQRIRALRLQMGWTQERLAAGTKLTRAYLVAVEGGKQNVTMDVVIRIANALNVPPDRLLGREELDSESKNSRST